MANGQSLNIEFETVFFIKSVIYLPAVEFDNIFIHLEFWVSSFKINVHLVEKVLLLKQPIPLFNFNRHINDAACI